MFNKNFITFFLVLILFQAISAEILKKDEVLKINPKQDTNNCPNSSFQIIINNTKYCHYNYYCKDDTCYSSSSLDSGLYVTNENRKKLYVENYCNSNDDCLSGVCNMKRCDNTSLTQCVTQRNGTSIACGKLAQSDCTADNECASGVCGNLGGSNKCEVVLQEEIISVVKKSINLIILLIIFIILAIAACIGICICCCIKKRKSKEDPMV